jgi:hypothetical protein
MTKDHIYKIGIVESSDDLTYGLTRPLGAKTTCGLIDTFITPQGQRQLYENDKRKIEQLKVSGDKSLKIFANISLRAIIY